MRKSSPPKWNNVIAGTTDTPSPALTRPVTVARCSTSNTGGAAAPNATVQVLRCCRAPAGSADSARCRAIALHLSQWMIATAHQEIAVGGNSPAARSCPAAPRPPRNPPARCEPCPGRDPAGRHAGRSRCRDAAHGSPPAGQPARRQRRQRGQRHPAPGARGVVAQIIHGQFHVSERRRAEASSTRPSAVSSTLRVAVEQAQAGAVFQLADQGARAASGDAAPPAWCFVGQGHEGAQLAGREIHGFSRIDPIFLFYG